MGSNKENIKEKKNDAKKGRKIKKMHHCTNGKK